MPAVDGYHHGRRIITPLVLAHPDDPWLANALPAQGLMDTGASVTAISRDLARELSLQPEGKRSITNTHGMQQAIQYRFRLGFLMPAANTASTPFMLAETVFGIDFTATPNFQVLIGMDIISQGTLEVHKAGHWHFAF